MMSPKRSSKASAYSELMRRAYQTAFHIQGGINNLFFLAYLEESALFRRKDGRHRGSMWPGSLPEKRELRNSELRQKPHTGPRSSVVRRVSKDLISNDEAEISEVVRRRLFEDIGSDRVRKTICKTYADKCFDRHAQLPPEWTAVDSAAIEAKAREYLRGRFKVCYPLHPATLSVFQRKWQALSQYQQTRGALAMLAQWISWTYRTGFTEARREPLITLGSAPLELPEVDTTSIVEFVSRYADRMEVISYGLDENSLKLK